MPQFEITINQFLYTGDYEVQPNELDLFNVVRRDDKEVDTDVNRKAELQAVAEAIENGKYSDDISEERQRIFHTQKGRFPEPSYDY